MSQYRFGQKHFGVLLYNFRVRRPYIIGHCRIHSSRKIMASTPSTLSSPSLSGPQTPAQQDDEPQLQDGHLPDVTASHFAALDLRIGTITAASPNAKARKPAYKLTIDFGPVVGTKTSSAQITHYYKPDDLVGRQIVAAVNLGERRVAGVKSQVLVLGADGNGDGIITLLSIERPVPNGTTIA
ncbi:hypothetical protein V1525DRAFT_414620 [Lipomyces kononenkoae]|uniref:Uncharacterized protein n=1 Tax=Lipomyces kononenkoae TaxID=34357 RepID=A0ACC3ST99_LIPKO